MVDCCHLVGNFFSESSFNFPGCIISANNTVNTEINDYGCSGSLVQGPRIGTLNLSGYSGTEVYKGCPARAGVQVLWMRKFRCDINETHFIFLGPGRSFMQEPAAGYVSLSKEVDGPTETIVASAQSGPATLFTIANQIEGLGMSYTKGPIAFSTDSESGVTLSNMGVGKGSYYLQNFNIELVPGAIPVASYTFAYNA